VSTLSVFDAARELPDAPALLDGPVTLSFGEVARRTEPLARALLEARPQALALTPRADTASLLWLYAALATGTPLLPLHLRATASEREQAMQLANASPAPEPLHAQPPLALASVDDRALLAMLPTSGSTGAPRLVKLSRRALLASAHASARNLGWEPDDRWLLCLPLAHAGGLSIVLRCLLARKSLILFEPGGAGLLSALIFPAYLVDRQLAQIVPGSKAQWPEHLPVVNALMVGIYAAWTVLILRFLRRAGASEGVAWVAALAGTFTLPAAAFPFQYYPELVAGLLVTVVAGHLLFASADRRRRAFVVGLLAGCLPWLHVRFSAVTMAFALAAIVIWRADRRRLLGFLGGIAVPVALFSLYTYRISGSVMPSALWTASGDENNFAWLSMVRNSVAYLVDRDWGLFAHSPVFLLALPGYWWMAKRQPAVAWMSAAVFLALLLPAAGKTLIQTTPMRLIVAVVPLAATPLVEVLSRGGRATRIGEVAFDFRVSGRLGRLRARDP